MSWLSKPIVWCALWISLLGCAQRQAEQVGKQPHALPILSRKEWNGTDSVYRTIRSFSLLNQDSQIITGKRLLGKIHVADFFFTSCPSICPIMTGHLKKVQEAFSGDTSVLIVSYSIDPEHDRPHVLRAYAKERGIDTRTWWLLTGPRDSIYALCTEDYLAYARPDSQAPGGFVHSGFLFLVDRQGLIRGAYDGTTASKVEELIQHIQQLKYVP
ncbi:MAG: SCO family protein [Flavobacteriales bacterium]|nr:SCO family protein [Flavobacteriales bacterium]MCX7769068.1 SCO family protein [Flavobacteriales bacterium]MDW8410743.1 SCO family protein [Flavobacteriales bacterium]